jgi:hypothetical protein
MCYAFIEEALLRPRMYFRDLPELEAILHGHGVAFGQLGLINREEPFNRSFAAWLRRETGASAAAGWADAVTQLAEAAGMDTEALFVERVRAFLREWAATASGP